MADFLIIGGGIVGLATAVKLQDKYPQKKILVLEKEMGVAQHQTGHNSGVIHSGLYYKPGSLKAKNCIGGYKMLLDFCEQYNVPYEITGKLVVAVNNSEIPYLNTLKERGAENGLNGIKELRKEEITEYEPHVAGVAGIYVPQTGIIDYKQVANKYAEVFQNNGGTIQYNQKVTGIFQNQNSITVESERSTFHTSYIINCAGLYSDYISRIGLNKRDIRVIPFRGEYYKLVPEKEYLIRNLIYPVPNPNFPFLGVHFTRMIGGGVEAGPNAVLAFKKEGYLKKDFNIKELADTLSWPGFIKVALKYWSTGLGEMYRSYSKSAFTKALQQLVPEIKSEDLVPGGSGVRAQACDRTGGLLDDFYIEQNERQMHVCNAPSPAATSSLSIAHEIVRRV